MKENEKKIQNTFTAFITFMKIGTFTFGGGYAMIPAYSERDCGEKKWVDDEDILNIVAIAESTPKFIAINTSTFVGISCWRFLGSCCWNCWHDTAVICNNTGNFFCVEKDFRIYRFKSMHLMVYELVYWHL